MSEPEEGESRKAERDSEQSASFETTTKDGERIHFNAYAR